MSAPAPRGSATRLARPVTLRATSALAALLALAAPASPQQATGTAAPPDDDARVIVRGELGEMADAFLRRAARERGFAGVVLLSDAGEIVLRKGYGVADRARGLPYRADSYMDVGSLTKQFTATAILALEAEGRLSVEDRLDEHFTNVPPDKAGITLHQLLTHSSGLEPGFGGDYVVMPRDSLVRLALDSRLRFEPGTDWSYSNAGYSLLGAIVEKTSGLPYERYVHERLLVPAGLRETGYAIPDFVERRMPGGVTNEGEYWGSPLHRLWAGDGPYWNLRTNGGHISTVSDLFRWDRALASGDVLPPAAMRKLTTGYVPVADRFARRWGEDVRYAYGWTASRTPAGRMVAHGGTAAAFCAGFRRWVEHDAALIFGTNHCPNRDVELELRDSVERALAERGAVGNRGRASGSGSGSGLGSAARAARAAAAGADSTVVRGPVGRAADAYLTRVARERGFAGTVLVAHGGDVVLRKGYGLSDRENGVPFTPGTIYDIGSITKQFTAAGLLALEAEGKLAVEDRLDRWFPEAPSDKAGITLHQLLTHSAGIRGGFGGDYEVMPRDSLVRLALEAPLDFEPGTSYRYSNVGYSLLGTIIEKAAGMPYERWLSERLFEPAGLVETGYVIPDWHRSRLAFGYDREGEPWGTSLDSAWAGDGPYWSLRTNGGILSTVDDLLRWHRALSAPGVLPAEQLEKLHGGYVTQRPDDPASARYGYGWTHRQLAGGGRLMAHNGSNAVFYATFMRFLDDDLVLIYGTNEYKHRVVDRELGEVLLEAVRGR